MNNSERCRVCRCSDKLNNQFGDDFIYNVSCPFCGNYRITSKMEDILEDQYSSHTLACWVSEQNSYGITPLLHQSEFDKLMNISDKSLNNKYELFIDFFNKRDFVLLSEYDRKNRLIPYTWCKDGIEYDMLLSQAIKLGHIIVEDRPGDERPVITITFEGRVFIEKIGIKTKTNKIFMAFHFTNEMKEQFQSAIVRAVSDASENKLEVIRVSSSTTDYDRKIDDELIGMIKSSKAVIADFTGNRTAVYYEAGYAMGLGIPVIWTCRESDVNDLSFDTRQYPHIIWKDEEDLYTQVVNRLKAKIL